MGDVDARDSPPPPPPPPPPPQPPRGRVRDFASARKNSAADARALLGNEEDADTHRGTSGRSRSTAKSRCRNPHAVIKNR